MSSRPFGPLSITEHPFNALNGFQERRTNRDALLAPRRLSVTRPRLIGRHGSPLRAGSQLRSFLSNLLRTRNPWSLSRLTTSNDLVDWPLTIQDLNILVSN